MQSSDPERPPAPDDDGGAAEQPGRPREDFTEFVERVRPLIGAGEAFRWISEGRRLAYAAILYYLWRRRMAHEIEVYHDDLLDEMRAGVGAVLGPGYDALQFRSDVEQLQRWGNLSERVEPQRIRSLADRTRSKLLLRLSPDTSAFLQFLRDRAEPLPLGVRHQGANLLEDLLGNLKEALRGLRQGLQLLQGDRTAPELEELEERCLRASHLLYEADHKAERIAEELVQFGEELARFVAEPFRVESLNELGGWLERYLERYLTVLEEKGRSIRRVLGSIAKPALAPVLAEAERLEYARLADTPLALAGGLRLRGAADVLAGLRRFFDEHEGLSELCRRINRRTRGAIRRIQRHVEAVRLRNVRTEAIRARTAELFALPEGPEGDEAALEFIEGLVAPVNARSDARPGSPEKRAASPRPAKRYESLRPAFQGEPLGPKRTTPEGSRELERLRLERLSAFIEERVLQGRPRGRFAEARLDELDHGRLLVRAVAAWMLRGGRARKHLRYVLEDPGDGRRAVLGAEAFDLELPDLAAARREPS